MWREEKERKEERTNKGKQTNKQINNIGILSEKKEGKKPKGNMKKERKKEGELANKVI